MASQFSSFMRGATSRSSEFLGKPFLPTVEDIVYSLNEFRKRNLGVVRPKLGQEMVEEDIDIDPGKGLAAWILCG
ncbi:MAG: hypothetical protein ACJAVK_000881 [Akkermansiaceae bacterium]